MSEPERLDFEHELARLERKARTSELLDELSIGGGVASAMLDDPGRAEAVLLHAKGMPGIKNPAAFAIAEWRRGFDPRKIDRTSRDEPELVEEPPTLSAIEYAWSVNAELVLPLMTTAIARTGGFEPVLERGWWTRERFDADGELVEHAEP